MAYAKAAQSLATAKSLKVAATGVASNNSTISNTSSSTSSSSSGHQSHSSLQNGVCSIGSEGSSNSAISAPQYSVDETTALVELLTGLGCPESAPLTASGTLPRRRDTLGTPYEKTVSGII